MRHLARTIWWRPITAAALIGVAATVIAEIPDSAPPFNRESTPARTESDESALQVIARVKELGGDVVVDDRKPVRVWFGPESRLRDDDLEALDPTGLIIVLVLKGLPLTDECLKHAAAMKGLKQLVVADVPVTGSGLVHFADRDALRTLVLSNTRVADERLKILSEFRELMHVHLGETRTTDKSLSILGMLKRLRTIDVHSTDVTDDGLKHLDGLRHLTQLDLSDTNITGAGLVDVALPNLKFLFLERTQAGDAQLEMLSRFTTLHTVNLSYTNVTDKGLRHLGGVKTLRRVVVYHTKVTSQGANRLEAVLPRCDVSFGSDIDVDE